MTLLDYVKPLDRPALEALATRCSTTAGQLRQVAYGYRRASAALAIALDRETSGEIRCEVTRPDIDWAYLRNSAASVSEPAPPEVGWRCEERQQKRREGDRCLADRRL